MTVSAIIFFAIVLKIPVIAACYLTWWAVKDPPEQVLSEVEDGGDGPTIRQGPRVRDPLGSGPNGRAAARSAAAHPKPRRTAWRFGRTRVR